MYFNYIKERHGHLNKDVIVIEDVAFAVYQIFISADGTPYIHVHDFYIVPEKRGKEYAAKLLKELKNVASIFGCKVGTTQIDMNAHGWEASLIMQIKLGARPTHMDIEKNILYLMSELEEKVPSFDYTINVNNPGEWKKHLKNALDTDSIVDIKGRTIYVKRGQ